MSDIIIRPLCPALCGDWLAYFDRTAFQDHQERSFCYCLEGYLDPQTQETWTDPGERRAKAVEFIQTGVMQGYLAYQGDTVVGWCNVNARENYQYLTCMFQRIGYQPETDGRTKVVYCFLIAPDHRGQGIAQKLLDRACEDAAREGYAYMEAYPFADKGFSFQYHGTGSMYARSGFVETADLQYVKVMRKKLPY